MKKGLLILALVFLALPLAAAECGDGICDANETEIDCPEDCGPVDDSVCGDGNCTGAENYVSCPGDCEVPGESNCGDGICDANETAESCQVDCDPDAGNFGDDQCPTDTFSCPDGMILFRDPALDCEFPDCSDPVAPPEECVPLCGDGACQQEDCLGDVGCPCYETEETCPEDCSSGFGGFNFMKYMWVGLSIIGAVLFIFIGLKVLKWLFWLLAIIMIALAVAFIFVL